LVQSESESENHSDIQPLSKLRSRYDANIEIRFREGESEVAGATRNFFERYGLITKSFVTIYERGFPFEFSDDQIEQIAKHDIGHVLGVGHANFDNTLMSTRVHYGPKYWRNFNLNWS
jgi:predicted Zn-dependent protease